MDHSDKVNDLKGRFKIITSKNGEVIRETPYYNNIVVDGTNTGYNLILKRLYGDNTWSLNIKYLEIGTGSTTPAITDTALVSASARVLYATKEITSGSVKFRFFLPNGELPDGTYRELGLYVDGTATIDTGKMFTRALLGADYTKDTNEDTTIEYEIFK